ncbi:peptidyl-prolyl cis-trans isomerase FKBP53-like [Phragmites australis]|uniref:peptidyl-prolyl cis-trans isomerase FKBP53-like n=1 Tax=Phragmites australis TaxID=29695 RepID=UPI002D7702AD|nr:peptidyl-prolyl cis-trans isomerase FKBP53-like [Phragmites australis]
MVAGVEVKPGEPYIHQPSRGRRLKITQAMLGNHVDVGCSMLQCNVGDKEPVRLCTLNPMDALMCHLKLEYEESENVVFSVFGNSSVHLSGYYIHSHIGDHGHYSEKLTSKTASPTDLMRKHQGDEADGKNDASLRKPNTGEGEDFKIMESNAVHIGPTLGDEMTQKGNVLQPAVHEQNALQTEGKHDVEKHIIGQMMISDEGYLFNDATDLQGVEKQNELDLPSPAKNCGSVHTEKGPISSLSGDHHGYYSEKITSNNASPICFKRKHQGDETDGKNYDSLNEPILIEDGDDDDDEHLPIRVAYLKRRAAENRRKCKMPRKEHVLSDQNSAMGQVNDKKYSKVIVSNAVHIVPTQDHKNHKGNVVQCSAGAANQRTGQTGSPIMAEGFLFAGATELQNEDAEHCGSVHTGKGPIRKITLDSGLIIDDLNVGSANGVVASNGSEVTVKYVGTLLDGQIIDPMDVYKFKLGAGHVILGWDLGIPGMSVGGKRRLTIPPALGYGNKAQENIPSHSWLVYEVELMEVE